MLITLMLLAILTVGAVSASDDAISDDLTANDEVGDEISQVDEIEDVVADDDVQEDIVGDGEKANLVFNHKIDDEVMLNDSSNTIGLYYYEGSNTTGPVTGNVSISIDGKEYYNQLAQIVTPYVDGQVKLDELYQSGNLTFGTHSAVIKFFGDPLYNDFTIEKPFNYTFYRIGPVEGYVGPDYTPWFAIYFVKNATGNFTVILDGKEIYNTSFSEGEQWMYVEFGDLEVGSHEYTINYTGNYPSIFKSYSFIKSYMSIRIQDAYAGRTVTVYVRLPSDATQNLTITYKGKQYEVEPESQILYNEAMWTTDDYTLGENPITFSYQDAKYPHLEITETFTIEPEIMINGVFYYNSSETAQFTMSPDATGKFVLYLDNKDNKIGEVELTNGRGSFSFDGIPVGKYRLIVSYEGDDYELADYVNSNFYIIPNVIIPEAVNVNESYNVTIIVNPNIRGTFLIEDEDGTFINRTKIEDDVPSGILTIPLNLTPGHHRIYVMFMLASSGEILIDTIYNLNVRNDSRDWKPILEVPDNVNLSDWFDDEYCGFNITNIINDGNGVFTLIINDDIAMKMPFYNYYDGIPLYFTYLNEGINNWTLYYTGDNYYNDYQVNGTITAFGELKQSIKANIPQNSEIIMYDDWKNDGLLYFDINKNLWGDVQIVIDGEATWQLPLTDFDVIDAKGYRSVPITFNNLSGANLQPGQHEGKVIIYAYSMYSPYPEKKFSDVFSFTLYEAQIVKNDNVTIEIIPIPTIISDNDSLVVITAKDNTSNVTIYVDDSQTPITLPLVDCRYDENVGCFIIGSKELGLDAGSYKLKVSYPGEGAEALSLTGNITLLSSSIALEDVVFVYGESGTVKYSVEHGSVDLANISIIDANGNAVITAKIVIDGDKIIVSNLDYGTYTLKVTITPEEGYPVKTANATITVNKANAAITAADKAYVINYGGTYSVTLKDANGNVLSGKKVTFTLNGKNIGTATTNAKGVASIKLTANILKAAKAGNRNLVIKFAGDTNYNAISKTVKITINKEKTKIVAKKKTFKKSKKVKKYKITLKNSKGKAVKKVKVTIKIKGKGIKAKTFKAKTNAKGKATFKIKKLTKKGTFKAKITFKATSLYLKSAKTVKIKIK